eukprot:jgi/Ulvmu1/4339/UM002_0062.1
MPSRHDGLSEASDVMSLNGDRSEHGSFTPLILVNGESNVSQTFTSTNATAEAKRLLWLTLPMMAQNLCGYGVQVVAYLYIARLGATEIAPVVLAQTTFNIAGFSIVIGLLGAMDTLCGQAWGALEYRTCGVVLQRGMLVTIAVSVPIILCWTQITPLLLLVGQSPEIVAKAVPYLVKISPVLVVACLAECVTKWLTSQNVVYPSTFVNLGVVMLAPIIFHMFTVSLPWGLAGAAAAMNASNVLDLLALIVWSIFYVQLMPMSSPVRKVWPGFTLDAIKRWPTFFQLGIPSMAMLCLQWWAFEVCTIVAGILPEPQTSLGVTGVCIQLIVCAFMVPLGICQGVRIRVSNLLGAGNATAAKGTIAVAVTLCLGLITLCLAILVPSRALLARVFFPELTLDSDPSKALMDCILLIAAGLPADWLNCTLSGVLQGTGRQALGAQVYVVTYWCIGPVAVWLFAFHFDWRVRGIWAALAVLANVEVLFMIAAISTIDWDEEVARAKELVKSQQEQPPSTRLSRPDSNSGTSQPLLVDETSSP